MDTSGELSIELGNGVRLVGQIEHLAQAWAEFRHGEQSWHCFSAGQRDRETAIMRQVLLDEQGQASGQGEGCTDGAGQ